MGASISADKGNRLVKRRFNKLEMQRHDILAGCYIICNENHDQSQSPGKSVAVTPKR